MAPTFICVGVRPFAGCGRTLSDEERHYYGTACERCTRLWGEAVTAWRRGGDDADLDKMFSAPAAGPN